MGPLHNHCIDSDSAYAILLSEPARGSIDESRLFGNRWHPQTTCAGCVESSGNLLPPSPPAEKATASQDQAGKSGTGDGRGHVHRRWVEQRRLDEPANVTLGKRWVWTALKHKHLGDLE